jgi:hypothetical protein
MRFSSGSAAATVALSVSLLNSAQASPPQYVLDLTPADVNIRNKINVQICSGLMNRDERDTGGVYTLMDEPYDSDWLADAEGVTDPELTSIDSFLSTCASMKDLVKGYILYDYASQQVLVPNLITMASIMDALLLESSDPMTSSLPLLFDSITTWKGYNAVNSTAYMYENHIDATSTLAWMNPGYDQHQDPKNPPLTRDLNPKLIDYIVKTRIFNFYMNDACIKGTDDYELMSQIVVNNPWARSPLPPSPPSPPWLTRPFSHPQTHPCLWLQ